MIKQWIAVMLMIGACWMLGCGGSSEDVDAQNDAPETETETDEAVVAVALMPVAPMTPAEPAMTPVPMVPLEPAMPVVPAEEAVEEVPDVPAMSVEEIEEGIDEAVDKLMEEVIEDAPTEEPAEEALTEEEVQELVEEAIEEATEETPTEETVEELIEEAIEEATEETPTEALDGSVKPSNPIDEIEEATEEVTEEAPVVPTLQPTLRPALVVEEPAAEEVEDTIPAALDFTMTTIDGDDKDLSDYAGKVLLVVNTASYCGYTPQYAGLQTLHDDYADEGLAVLAFPANNFGGQEPGTDAEIKTYCTTNYNVDFDIFSKISVAGDDRDAFYDELTSFDNSAIGWNFEKFLIGRDGTVIAHYRSNVTPAQLTEAIETELAKEAPEDDE
jgi:glutathione peroxidase